MTSKCNRDNGSRKEVSLYVVRSPLQLLNCYEASQRYADGGYKILLVLYRQEFDRDQMVNLLDESNWDEIIIEDFRSNLVQIKLISGLLKKIDSIGMCFLGDYTHSVNVLINLRKPQRVIWIDDGVATLQCAKLLADAKFFTLDKHFHKKNKITMLLEKLSRSDRNYLKDAEFFTIYDNIRSYSSQFKVLLNDYRHLRKCRESLQSRDVVYFIGNDLRRYVLSDPDRFESYIASVSKHYLGRDWRYILHRKEDVGYMQKLSEKHGFRMEKFDRILEQQFACQGWYPVEIATICSSALDTLSIIYRPRLTAFLLLAEDIREDRKVVIRELYSHYERIQVKMLSCAHSGTAPSVNSVHGGVYEELV